MYLKSLLVGLSLLLSAQSALACNLYRTGENGEYLECRSSYKNFMLADTNRVERIVEAAKYFALGELQKLSNESWMIRQALTVDEGEQLLQNRVDAKIIMDQINDQLRQRAAQEETLSWYDINDIVPSAFVMGLTISINKKLPLNSLFSKLPALQPGGSIFAGVIMIPQKIDFKMNTNGVEMELSTIEKITWDYRTVIIPSADGRLGSNGQFKQQGPETTFGMVFGENIYSTHQLLGQGWAVSLPTQVSGVIPNLPVIGPLGNGILRAAALAKVDTVKIGLTRASQHPELATNDDAIKSYSENLWMWFRWNNSNALQQAMQGTPADAVADLQQGKGRISAFWVMEPWSDGESTSFYNGLGGEGAAIFGGILTTALENYLREDELEVIAEETDLSNEQKEALRESLMRRGVIESPVQEEVTEE
ncbi:MAG: hypothetical protein HRT44_07305 [Bdellovibrionales bacterium]|nr:hypothetical protein [Bdellovibrionales bacterium]